MSAMTPASELRVRFRAVIDAITTGNLDALGDLVRYDVVDHNLVPAQGDGLPGLAFWAAGMRRAIPDLTATIEDTLVDGTKLAARVTFAGTNSGDHLGMPATDAYLEFETFFFVEFTDGMVTQWWDASNIMPALRQVGAELTLPPTSDERWPRYSPATAGADVTLALARGGWSP
jgi:predicted ester cyclase